MKNTRKILDNVHNIDQKLSEMRYFHKIISLILGILSLPFLVDACYSIMVLRSINITIILNFVVAIFCYIEGLRHLYHDTHRLEITKLVQ